ncbi:hypothetical protein CN540_28340 [Bacillus toyonensis]|uniref:HesA/MoeB/ThiF family protein n=1 Tax=Bacillus toyonensis TaxID=155322 RepID=UPI000BEB7938|nr:ThiF family adenylyltransferase [Bacillus toyonensis]PED90008.1 hypothetical protein CON90_28685 [Bacillus toyonensis]PEK43066.1 hypothetical protein CN588_24730 [Bacillus toyonensis]PEN47011.1 hypothetical protein CN540_28340 [Bacillus toyonensis]PFZ33045.1 hypothetical protein COL64_24780 [Bacillus toyonensis]PGE06971.1 hypothetical protein COM54_26330 [Bacillus toyonensis]
MNYRIPDRVGLLKRDDSILYLIDEEIIELSGCSEQIIRVIECLKSGANWNEVIHDVPKHDLEQLIKILSENNLIHSAWENEYIDSIANKQLYYFENICEENPNTIQKRLEQSCVAILGVGGVGTSIIQHLVGAGIKSFILVDDDTVALDNLNRQFTYTVSDVSRYKVDAARDYIKSIAPESDVRVHNCKIQKENDIRILDSYPIDFLINATDSSPQLPMIINKYSNERKIPFIELSVGVTTGSWGPITIPGKTVCLKCYREKEEGKMSSDELYVYNNLHSVIKSSFGPTNTVISTLAAMDIIHYLSGLNALCKSEGKRCVFNFQTGKIIIDDVNNLICSCWS